MVCIHVRELPAAVCIESACECYNTFVVILLLRMLVVENVSTRSAVY